MRVFGEAYFIPVFSIDVQELSVKCLLAVPKLRFLPNSSSFSQFRSQYPIKFREHSSVWFSL